jgi:HEAT repeat protein
VRSEAIKALVELESKEGLIKALNSGNAEARIEVAEALKDIGGSYALETLIEALTTALYTICDARVLL